MNTFGTKLKLTSFGESHGRAVGCVIDGVPAGLNFDFNYLQDELNKRRGGLNAYSTPRKEADRAEVLSGVFEGKTTGTPIAIVVFNENQHSKDYESLRELFRPGHADFTYFAKFGLRDHLGGGRSSARESVARVAAGAVAAMILREFNIVVESGVFSVGTLKSSLNESEFDFEFAKQSEIFALDKKLEQGFKDEITKARKTQNSVGAGVFTRILNAPAGLGEVLYDKLDSKLAHAMMGINAVKAVEIGAGISSSAKFGLENNDEICTENGKIKFSSNHAGGILGGISNGEEITIKSYFKPTPSIFAPQKTINLQNQNVLCELRGRHDPCVGVRGSVVATAMARLVIVDALLLNATAKLSNLKKIYL